MLVEHATVLPEGDSWSYEYLWPGERVLASKADNSVRLAAAVHRRDLTNRFPVVAAAVAKLPPHTLVIDGVVGSIDPGSLARLGRGAEAADPPSSGMRIVLIASDLLWLDGIDVRQLPLTARREKLEELLKGGAILPPLDPAVPVIDLIAKARQLGAEAVLAKRRDSKYRPFGRSGDWVRVSVQPPAASESEREKGGASAEVGMRASGAFGLGQLA